MSPKPESLKPEDAQTSHGHHHSLDSDISSVHPFARKFLWLDHPAVKRNFIWFAAAGILLTVVIGYFFPTKHPAPWEGGLLYTVSYFVIGFVAYSIVVFSAWPLFRVLSRPENYYGEEGQDD